MKCPADDTVLSIADRQGVEIDWCPTCRGVWLDRNELDKILDRSMAELNPPSAPSPIRLDGHARTPDRDRNRDEYRDRDRDGSEDRGRGDDGRRPKKRSSMLSELFEF